MKSYRKVLTMKVPSRMGLVNITEEVKQALAGVGHPGRDLPGESHAHYRFRVYQ